MPKIEYRKEPRITFVQFKNKRFLPLFSSRCFFSLLTLFFSMVQSREKKMFPSMQTIILVILNKTKISRLIFVLEISNISIFFLVSPFFPFCFTFPFFYYFFFTLCWYVLFFHCSATAIWNPIAIQNVQFWFLKKQFELNFIQCLQVVCVLFFRCCNFL